MFIGIILREIFSFWTGHPFDFELWIRVGYWVAHGVSPYGVLPAAPELSFASVYSTQSTATVGYLPFWPLLMGAIYELYHNIGLQSRFLFYFLLKQPAIIGDVLLGYILYQYVKNRKDSAEWVLKFWLFSPLNIILSGVWGMFDSLAMLFVMLAINWRNQSFRAINSGLATFVKSIPAIYILPLALSGTKKTRNLVIALAIPAILSIVAIFASGWSSESAYGALSSTVTKGGESLSAADILFYLNSAGMVSDSQLQITKSFGYLWVIAVLIATFAAYKKFGFKEDFPIIQAMLTCTIVFLVFRLQVNEQYAIYFFALSVVDVAIWNPSRRWMLFLSLGTVTAFLVVNSPLLVRFASPVFPDALTTESAWIMIYDFQRFTLKAILAVAFTVLNVLYFVAVFTSGNRKVSNSVH